VKDRSKRLLLSYGLAVAPLVSLGLVVFPLIRRSPISEAEATLFGVGLLTLLFLALVGCDRICGYFCAPKGYRGPFWFIRQVRHFKTFDLSELEREQQEEHRQ
jgi:hypothetical protein